MFVRNIGIYQWVWRNSAARQLSNTSAYNKYKQSFAQDYTQSCKKKIKEKIFDRDFVLSGIFRVSCMGKRILLLCTDSQAPAKQHFPGTESSVY
jgi:hypothetical protein